MGFLFGGGGGDGGAAAEARRAREEEQARQARIRQGTRRINEIFDGGGKPTVSGRLDRGATYDPNATYYLADGSVWSPDTAQNGPGRFGDLLGGLGQGVPSWAGAGWGRQPTDPWERAVSRGLYTSMTPGRPGFNEDFYNAQRDRYIDYAMPQVVEQKGKAGNELLFAMDRAGQTEGSARADLAGELEKRFELQAQKVRDDGLNYSSQSRNAVESARSDLIAMLNATGDAQGAAQSALARATALSQPAAYSPVGNLFADFTGALGTQAAAERAFAYGGGPRPTYNTGLFAPRSGSVVVG